MSPSSVAAAVDDRVPTAPVRLDLDAHRAETDERHVFLSTAAASKREQRLAGTIVLLSVLIFAALVPFATVKLTPVLAFIPAYEAALLVGDLVTAVLLFGQFSILRSRALLALGCGYLYAAVIAGVHALTYPAVFSTTGLLGANPQTTAWLYMFWHTGFPLAVIAYACLKPRDAARGPLALSARGGILGAIAGVCAVIAAIVWLTTAGAWLLPPIMIGNRYAVALTVVISSIWVFALIGFGVLWRLRPRTVLDLWLMVVLSAWLADIALAAMLNEERYDLGFYAGRIYGLLAANFVLCVMLVDSTRLYGRLAVAARQLTSYAGSLEARVRERTRALERSNADERHAREEAVEAVRKLEVARAMNQRIFDTSVDLILVTDRRGTYLQVSPSVAPILGYEPEELIGRSATEILYPDDLENTRAEMRKARQGRLIRHFDCRYTHKDGHAVQLAWTGVWSEIEQRYYFTGRDMTDRLAAEAQLRQAQKMEAVGQLTGGVAHDFNNLLGIIVGNLDLLQEQLDADANTAELLGDALGAALRGAEVTRQLLAFSRRQPLQPKLVEPNEIVRGMTKLLARAIGEQIKVRLLLPENAWPVMIDPAQLESALLNLAVNARDAMPQGGTLTVETTNYTFDDEEAQTHVEGKAGDYVMVAVSDTGTGMPPEIVARVFEPFFSTKGVGKGTGLGLSMVYGFVKQSGGNAKIYSEPGRGTTIRLYLPRADAEIQVAETVETTLAVSRGGERVLVVEDNDGLRKLALRQLHDLGYETVETTNGVEALAVLESAQPFDLLFTDIVMPGGIDGRQLAKRAAALRPGLRVLFTSGFTAAAGAEVAAELSDRLLSKPFRKTELAQRVRAALDAPPDPRVTVDAT